MKFVFSNVRKLLQVVAEERESATARECTRLLSDAACAADLRALCAFIVPVEAIITASEAQGVGTLTPALLKELESVGAIVRYLGAAALLHPAARRSRLPHEISAGDVCSVRGRCWRCEHRLCYLFPFLRRKFSQHQLPTPPKLC